MDERAYVEKKQESWKHLAGTLDIIRARGLAAVPGDRLRTLGAEYRAVVSDLAFARTQGASESLTVYLNELAGRAHGAVYAARPPRMRGIVAFLFREFPELFRSASRFAAVAAIIFAIGCGTGAYLISAGYTAPTWLAPEGIDPAQLSSHIMTNNIQVSIIAFAAGATAGLLTVIVVFFNGMQIAIVAAGQDPEHARQLWAFVAPHGVIELTAIFIAGGAGLMVGSAIFAPGNMRRADAIRLAAGKALRLFAGTIPMLIVAGIIEGFVSPSPVPRWSKFAFSAVTALGLILYLGFAGRRSATANRGS